MKKSAFQNVAVIFLVTCFWVQLAQGDTLVVPNGNASTAGNEELSAPFNRADYRWQQIFLNSQFSMASGDVIEVQELRFRIDEQHHPIGSSFSSTIPGLSIGMATSPRDYSSVSTVYDENIEGILFQALPQTDLAVMGTRSSATSFDLVIPLPNAFQYDRHAGNLLIDIRIRENSGLPFLDGQAGLSSGGFAVFGSASAPSGTRTTQILVTHFQYLVVPEPNAVCLFAGAALLLLFKKKVSA